MSCSGNCSSCGSDCQKQPLRHPNITGAILGQFMMEMAVRSQKNAAGEITEEQMDEMDRKTMNWLGATFSGKNGQFEVDPEWYPVGVAGNLRMKLGEELAQAAGGKLPEDNATLIFSAMAVFMAEVYDTLSVVTKKGIEPLGEVPAPEMLALRDLELPAETVVVAVDHAGDLTVPNGDTVLKTGDEAVLFTNSDGRDKIRRLFA